MKKNSTANNADTHTRSRHAAAYVRMSKEQQRYSIENQMAAITLYAEQHYIEIVAHYSDGGKSGLNIKGRKGLADSEEEYHSK